MKVRFSLAELQLLEALSAPVGSQPSDRSVADVHERLSLMIAARRDRKAEKAARKAERVA